MQSVITSKSLHDFFCATYSVFQFLTVNCISSGSEMITLTKTKKAQLCQLVLISWDSAWSTFRVNAM